jgi:hypothetical protein
LKNSKQHGGVRVRLQEQFDASSVNALKNFHHDFFDRSNGGVEARSVGQATAEAFATEAHALNLLLDQANRYPFLEPLRPFADRLAKLAEKDYTYLLNHRGDFADELLNVKEGVLSPVKAFLHGPQRAVFDEAIAFLREEEANFAELPANEVQPLRDLAASASPYRGSVLPAAKAAVTRLRGLLADLLKAERDAALDALRAHQARLQAVEEFASLDESDWEQVLAPTVAAGAAIQSARFVSGIRDRLQRYNTQEYPGQLATGARLSAPSPLPEESKTGTKVPSPPPVQYVTASSLRPKFSRPYIATDQDLKDWLEALRAAIQEELDKGNRISV